MIPIERFQIKGLFGSRDVDLRIGRSALILVGPNGIGKSSVINILYFFISRQWTRLLEYKFSEVIVTIDGQEIGARRGDITGLIDLDKVMQSLSSTSRARVLIDRLNEANLLEEFAATPRMGLSQRKRFADVLNVPAEEILSLQRYIFRRFSSDDPDLFTAPRVSIEKALIKAFPSRTLYLPTYRRIEKDLREIFPDFEERYRVHISPESMMKPGRSSTHYVDLVSFGMEDVKTNLAKKTSEMRDYSLEQYNNLSGAYLRDVIRGVADKFASQQINDLTDDQINDILSRVSEQTLPVEDKNLLRQKVKALQGRPKSSIATNDRFLAHYFNRLVNTNVDISIREKDITDFVEVCNAYLNPAKRMIYDEIGFKVTVLDEEGSAIDLKYLSSGEKQIISIFSHLYLDDNRGQIVVIDEPELSLSVPWQKRFLTDIIDSAKCSFVVAVTHSPFIYDNALKSHAIDLRRRTSLSKEV